MSVWERSSAGCVAPVRVDLTAGVPAALTAVPAAAGVAEIQGPDGKSLLLTRSASIRKWVAANLGAGDAPKAGKRPKVDLSGVATAVSYVLAETPFERTLVYERWMAPLVPYSKRKDLRPPAFLRLDATQRFPRVVVVGAGDSLDHAFGPFRDRKAAERASTVLHKLFPLRPCDHVFEPHEELALGRACLYGQVRSCAAPCLVRVSQDAYRKIALDATEALASPLARNLTLPVARARASSSSVPPPDPPGREGAASPGTGILSTLETRVSPLAAAVPAIVGAALGRGLVVSMTRGGGVLHPVTGGRVLDGVRWVGDAIEDAVLSLAWEVPVGAPDDWPWLATWLLTPAGRASFVVVTQPPDVAGLAAAIRAMA